MYAIIETGGKQYKVASGDTIKAQIQPAEEGSSIKIDKVLAVMDGAKTIAGAPYISGAAVKAEVMGSGKTKKVIVYKQKPRKGYRKLRGHRQPFTLLKIMEINAGG